MAKEKPRAPEYIESGPPRLPSSSPAYPGSDYSFTLQTVMELQKSVGQLIQAVETLTEHQKDQGKKLDRMSHQIYAALVVLILFGGILTFFAKGINDLIVHRIESQSSPQTSPHKD